MQPRKHENTKKRTNKKKFLFVLSGLRGPGAVLAVVLSMSSPRSVRHQRALVPRARSNPNGFNTRRSTFFFVAFLFLFRAFVFSWLRLFSRCEEASFFSIARTSL